MPSLKERLIDILLKHKLLTEDQLNEAIKRQREEGGSLQDILVRLKFVDSRDALSIVSESLKIPPISLRKFKPDKTILNLLPKELLSNYQVIPISKIGNRLTIAMADPLNVFAIDEIKTLTRYEIDVVVAEKKEIEDAICAHFGESAVDMISKISQDIHQSKLEFIKSKEEIEAVDSTKLLKSVDEAPVVQITNMLLGKAVSSKASDILIEPMEDSLRIRYRIDGTLTEFESSPPKSMHNAIVSRIKVMSQLNIAERRLPQDGRFKIAIDGRDVDFRVSIVPSRLGEKVAIRLLDRTQVMLDIDRLGMHRETLEKLKKCAMHPYGMLLVCGPTGCGKTTTLYSILKYVDSPEKNLITVEDPVEYMLDGINQVSVRQDIGLTFAISLRSILRQDPDIIMVGEIRDFETVDVAIKSALTGHLLLATLHTNTACGSIVRLVNMGVEPFLIASSLICVVAQRLIRQLCPNCKEPYELNEKTLSSILSLPIAKNIKPKGSFYKGKGCKTCRGSGYKGRVAIAEILVLDSEIAKLIVSRASEERLKEYAKDAGMITLREDGLSKVFSGITTVDEVMNITAED